VLEGNHGIGKALDVIDPPSERKLDDLQDVRLLVDRMMCTAAAAVVNNGIGKSILFKP
jgi:hypothetical protein